MKNRLLRIKHRVTVWHNENTNPVRTGLYQVIICIGISEPRDVPAWCWFGPGGWGWAYECKAWALQKQWRSPLGATQKRIWRGIVK